MLPAASFLGVGTAFKSMQANPIAPSGMIPSFCGSWMDAWGREISSLPSTFPRSRVTSMLRLRAAALRRGTSSVSPRWLHSTLRSASTSASNTGGSSSNAPVAAPPPSHFQGIASQTNGLQHGSTLYGVSAHAPTSPSFEIHKTHEHVLTLWRKQQQQQLSDETERPGVAAILRSTSERSIDFLSDLFLPRDFRKSVSPDYMPYAKWYFMGTIASAASGVLSMQSLLYAIGLGAGSIPTAAAVNWVLKDGLGQFGGVMFASLVNNRYDADPKRWRVASAVSLDLAGLMEIFTPLFPAYFLPMASLANVSKNVSWLSASATRAGFHNSFALRENLADITAKAGSQAIASSIIGTGLGIAVSQYTGAETWNVLGAFLVLSAMHQYSVYKALVCVSLRTLNCQRLHLVLDHFLASDAQRVPHQDAIAEQEKFMQTLITGYVSLYKKSIVDGNASLAQLSNNSPQELRRLKQFFENDKYLLNVNAADTGTYRIDVALEEDATSSDALHAHLHAVLLQRRLETLQEPISHDTLRQVCRESYDASKPLGKTFLSLLDASEWHTENLLVEEKGMRYKWL